MHQKLIITDVCARQILDSRGNPTLSAEVTINGKYTGEAAVPSGASTGMYEALELRDYDDKKYNGMGVLKAVDIVNGIIREILIGKDATNIYRVDEYMLSADGTKDKSKLGANSILAVSLASCKAAANALDIPLFRYLGGVNARIMPLPMMNILNGGAHASNNLDYQEFMIIPTGAPSFSEGIRWCVEVYHTLKKILKTKKMSTAVGDEGGFAPDVSDEREAIELILSAINVAGYEEERDFKISLDVAASEWKSENGYLLPKKKIEYTSEELINKYEELVKRYPIYSIEDPLDEEDYEGWKVLTERMGKKVLLVGDDLFVTNTERLRRGIEGGYGNAILIKPNQIGSVSETMEAVKLAGINGYKTIISHRSGETEDTSIADIAVALNAGYIKTGAPCRSERVAKYNRLLYISQLV